MIEELAVASLLMSAIAMISCLSVEDKRRIRRMPRTLWVVVILLVPLVGAVAWFALGRPHTLSTGRRSWRAAVGLPEPARPPAPEDDPTFLRSLRPPDDHPRRGDDPHGPGSPARG